MQFILNLPALINWQFIVRCRCSKFAEALFVSLAILNWCPFFFKSFFVVCACLKRELFEHHKLAGGRLIFLSLFLTCVCVCVFCARFSSGC